MMVARAMAALLWDLEAATAELYRRYPNLAAYGFVDRLPVVDRPDELQILRCLAWLADSVRRLEGENSYSLKHQVERWVRGCRLAVGCEGYIGNGAMLAALLLVGWPIRRRGPNGVVTHNHRRASRFRYEPETSKG